MKVSIPELSLVVLIGTSGSGKSTFARRHFKPTEVLSSDYFRGLVSDDENDQSATGDAFDTLHYVAGKRLAAGRLTVIDATNVQQDARKPLVALARKYHVLPAGRLRHRDHRFEWTRAEFATWADRVAERFGYAVRYMPIGPDDPEVGPPTQMAVFDR